MSLIQALLRIPRFGRLNGALDQGSVVALDRRVVGSPVGAVLHQVPATLARVSESNAESCPTGGSKPSLRTLSFASVVLFPIAIAGAYYFLIAADQFVAEFRFSLSSVEKPRFDALSLLTGGSQHPAAALESQIVV
jgi:hypothetical protein